MVLSTTIEDNSNGSVKPQKLIVIYSPKDPFTSAKIVGYFVRDNGSNNGILMDTPASSTSFALSTSSASSDLSDSSA